MHLPRHTLSSQVVAPAFVGATFAPSYTDGFAQCDTSTASSSSSSAPHSSTPRPGGHGNSSKHVFACATRSGFLVAQTHPLKVVARKDFPSSQGGLAIAAPIGDSSLLALVGGGRVPRFAPNKVVIWDEAAPAGEEYESSEEEDQDTLRFDEDGDRGDQGKDLGRGKGHDADTESATPTASRAASTVFDAGSSFEPRHRLRQDSIASSSSDTASSHAAESVMASSTASSRLGLAGLETSTLRAEHEGTDDMVDHHSSLEESTSSLTSSMLGSISATTEGLDDPFAEEKLGRPSTPEITQPSGSGAIPPATPSRSTLLQESPTATQSHESRARFGDSASDKLPPRPKTKTKSRTQQELGREVLELEFGEVVRSVLVRSFSIPIVVRADATPEAQSIGRSPATTFRMALVVVVLKTKAVLFELGEHIPTKIYNQHTDRRRGSYAPSWGITHRTTIDTLDDGRGLADLVGLPGKRRKRADSTSGILASSIIAAHEAPLAALALSADGQRLATASTRGTLIRVWSTTSTTLATGPSASTTAAHAAPHRRSNVKTTVKATLQHELRRGTEQALVLSMAFAPDTSVLAAASDKGTIHFFNLAGGTGGPTSHVRAGRSSSDHGSPPGSSTPSSMSTKASARSSSGLSLSGSAAKYLPAGLGQLASQIPSSMLPHYLKSHWSTAQFRIKLRTFAAFNSEERSKKTSTSSSSGAPSGGFGPGAGSGAASGGAGPGRSDVPPGGAGVARSTEGAWATLKGRLEDVRRWEPALDERVFLSWVAVSVPAAATAEASTTTPPPDRHGHARQGSTSTPARTPAPSRPTAQQGQGPSQSQSRTTYHLIALTTSGAWYRIALAGDGDASLSASASAAEPGSGASGTTGSAGNADTVLDMYKSSSRAGASTSAGTSTSTGTGATLLEYRTFGTKDEWGTEFAGSVT